jgi:hypothetical protein
MKLITNQKGLMEAPAMVLLLLLSILIGVQALIWQRKLIEARRHHQQTLCLKEAILETERLTKVIGSINQMLAAGSVSQGIGLFFPGAGWLLSAKWEKAKKVLMKLQEAAWWNSQRVFTSQKLSGCKLPAQFYQTPYEHGIKLERRFNLAKKRKNVVPWPYKTPWMVYVVHWKLETELATKLDWTVL